eukprot:5506882-Pleurochrysis_carterae.AAC.1
MAPRGAGWRGLRTAQGDRRGRDSARRQAVRGGAPAPGGERWGQRKARGSESWRSRRRAVRGKDSARRRAVRDGARCRLARVRDNARRRARE